MTRQLTAQELIEGYLHDLRRALRDVGDPAVEESLAEIRAHLEDGLEDDGPRRVLALMLELGPAEQLASALAAERLGGPATAPRPLRTLAHALDAVVALTPLSVLALPPVLALVAAVEANVYYSGRGGAPGIVEWAIMLVPIALALSWSVIYARRVRRDAQASVALRALGLDRVQRGGRSAVIQVATPAGEPARRRRNALLRLLVSTAVFLAAVTTIGVRTLLFDPGRASASAALLNDQLLMMQAEMLVDSQLDDYYELVRRGDWASVAEHIADADAPGVATLFPEDLRGDFAYAEPSGGESGRGGPGAGSEVVVTELDITEYFGDPLAPDRSRTVHFVLEYESLGPEPDFTEAHIRTVQIVPGPVVPVRR